MTIFPKHRGRDSGWRKCSTLGAIGYGQTLDIGGGGSCMENLYFGFGQRGTIFWLPGGGDRVGTGDSGS